MTPTVTARTSHGWVPGRHPAISVLKAIRELAACERAVQASAAVYAININSLNFAWRRLGTRNRKFGLLFAIHDATTWDVAPS